MVDCVAARRGVAFAGALPAGGRNAPPNSDRMPWLAGVCGLARTTLRPCGAARLAVAAGRLFTVTDSALAGAFTLLACAGGTGFLAGAATGAAGARAPSALGSARTTTGLGSDVLLTSGAGGGLDSSFASWLSGLGLFVSVGGEDAGVATTSGSGDAAAFTSGSGETSCLASVGGVASGIGCCDVSPGATSTRFGLGVGESAASLGAP